MSDLLEMITSRLDANSFGAIAQQLNGNHDSTRNAIESALPMLIAGLNKNAKSQSGAEAINNAVKKDHDGSVLDHLGAFLNRGPSSSDNRIVDHILGSRRPVVEQKIAESSGMDSRSITQLLATLAPMVMGALGKQRQQSGGGLGSIVDMLSQTTEHAKKGPGGGILGSLLDGDGDGDFDISDMTKLGGGLLNSFFK